MLHAVWIMKGLIYFAIGLALFGSGAYLTDLKWERDFANYKISEASKQDAAKQQWEKRLSEAEIKLADSVSALSRNRDELEWMRNRASEIERGAKSAEAKWSARCAKLAVRYREAVERVKPAIEFCATVLK
ncbi:MAG: hypothetical protein IJ022_05595 [Burkholderiaceae bacterium]|nr:hypothetical protein [Burkholderiaceae bacterium]